MCQTVPLGNGSVSSYKGQNYPQKYHLGEQILTTSNFDNYFNFVPLARTFKALVKNRCRGEISTPKNFFTKVIFSNQMSFTYMICYGAISICFQRFVKYPVPRVIFPPLFNPKTQVFSKFQDFYVQIYRRRNFRIIETLITWYQSFAKKNILRGENQPLKIFHQGDFF